ncbi:tyrosinase family protein [Kitasatospora cystarginea]|uniref:Tyrosinase family protein n=1 Tax=Kitasatospora cystarginea TaxID=58350 RepID=A0ABN3E814_9ACTN
MTNSVRIRRDVTKMKAGPSGWDVNSDIFWYAHAVGVMMNDYDEDPRSWRWQANIHGSGSPDPDSPPPKPNPDWNHCPHGGWFFLPWHRGYLYYFEDIVRSVVKKLGGPENWALPYWNYTRVANHDPLNDASKEFRKLPEAFRTPKIPHYALGVEVDNPLYDMIKRNSTANQGFGVAWELVNPTDAMRSLRYPGVRPDHFGSKDTGAELPHDKGDFGCLESVPHNKIHLFVGGWMGVFISPRDPIFWLHHANIDRIWPAWLAKGGGRKNPETEDWLLKPFTFWDRTAKKQTISAKSMLDTEKQLGYKYEDLEVWEDPVKAERKAVVLVAANPGPTGQVLGTAGGGELGPEPVTVPVQPETSATRALSSMAEAESARNGQRVVLTIRDVRADESPGTTFRVLLGADQDREADLAPDSPYFVGHLDFFGAIGGDIHHHGGRGFDFSFDVTDQLRALREQGLWDGTSVPSVVLAPVPLEAPPELAAALTVPPPGSRPRYGSVVLTNE